MPDPRKQRKEIPFSGKCMTGEPAMIGANFRTLKNLRYTDTHVKGIGGMTKINTAAMNATYLKARNAFHFCKYQPAESHLLVQAYNAALAASVILDNTTAIPSAGAFSATALHTDSAGAGRGRFAEATDGQMVYANGVDTCMWGGNEMQCGAFITSTAEITTGGATNPKDYTDIINNTKTDADNVAIIGGGIDSYTKLLIHGDEASGTAGTSILDTSGTTKTVTANGNAATSNLASKFGPCSVYFDGTGDYLSTPDHADFAGISTIDFWIKPVNFLAVGGVFYQGTDADNYILLKHSIDGSTSGTLNLIVKAAGVTVVDAHTATIDIYSFHHIAIVLSASGWAIYTNGVKGANSPTPFTWGNYTSTFDIGHGVDGGGDIYFTGYIDEFRVSKGIARWTAAFTPPSRPYRAKALYWLVGSPRPLQGLKNYISGGNGVASTMTGKVWDGNTWQALTITDNTDTGASLAATGTVTFSSTVTTAKPKYLEGYFLYWYQFAIDAGEAEIYRVTLDAPWQNIIDLWDGVYRSVTRCYSYAASVYTEKTTEVLAQDWVNGEASTAIDISGLGAFSTPNNCLVVGFAEKQTGLFFTMVPGYVQTTAATVMSVDYWSGAEWLSVGTISDGTSEGGISLAKSGGVSWNNNTLADETKKVIANSLPLYYYRLRWDKAMDASVAIDYIGGITAQIEISHYKFPIYAQGRVMLCCDMSGEKHMALVGGKYTPQVFQGADSVKAYFGTDGELTCGTELFSQFGASLFSLILMFKANETWMMAGQDIAQWANNTFLLSSSIGCPAPLTLKTINLHAEPGAGVNRALAIWQGANGIYMSDGRAPIPIHGDIKEFFDPSDSRCIKASMIDDSVSFIDPVKQEYHWLFASGSSATGLNAEWVYDIARNRWFEIDRTADLVCGVSVHDTDGNGYTYGFLDTGYMERLENGNDFDGTDITFTVTFGDIPLGGLAVETLVSAVRLLTVAKTTTENSVTCTHYGDTSTTGTAFTMSPARSGYRVAVPAFDEKLSSDPFHSFKFEMTTDNEACGFEPLAAVVTYHPVHTD